MTMEHKLESIFLSVINEGRIYNRRMSVAERSTSQRAFNLVGMVNHKINELKRVDACDDEFTVAEIFKIAKAVDDYDQQHLRESRDYAEKKRTD